MLLRKTVALVILENIPFLNCRANTIHTCKLRAIANSTIVSSSVSCCKISIAGNALAAPRIASTFNEPLFDDGPGAKNTQKLPTLLSNHPTLSFHVPSYVSASEDSCDGCDTGPRDFSGSDVEGPGELQRVGLGITTLLLFTFGRNPCPMASLVAKLIVVSSHSNKSKYNLITVLIVDSF